MWLDRLAAPQLFSALREGRLRFLPALVRHQVPPGRLDLRFRSDRRLGDSWATLYLGADAAARFRDDGTRLTIEGPSPNALKVLRAEGLVEAAFCSRVDHAVLDRQTEFRFVDGSERARVLAAEVAPLAQSVQEFAAVRSGSLPGPPKLGQNADAIAIDSRGRLIVAEIKPGDATGGISWAPAQVSFYAQLFRHWIATDRSAHATLVAMLAQRVELGLARPVDLVSPIEIVPVVGIGLPMRNESVARTRAIELQNDLLARGVGWPNLEFWGIATDGSHDRLDWA